MRSISVSMTAILLASGLVNVHSASLVLADEPPSQNPSAVSDRDAGKETGAKETAPATREDKDSATGPGDVQERAVRQGVGALEEPPVCVCISSPGQCVFSAVHGCVLSQGSVSCSGGCFEEKPQAGKVRPSVFAKAYAPILRRDIEGEPPTLSEKEGKQVMASSSARNWCQARWIYWTEGFLARSTQGAYRRTSQLIYDNPEGVMGGHDAYVDVIRSTCFVFATALASSSFALADEPAGQPAPSPTVQEEKATPAEAGEVRERGFGLAHTTHQEVLSRGAEVR